MYNKNFFVRCGNVRTYRYKSNGSLILEDIYELMAGKDQRSQRDVLHKWMEPTHKRRNTLRVQQQEESEWFIMRSSSFNKAMFMAVDEW